MISVDARKAIQDLRRALASLTPEEAKQAISRAENRSISVANTEARKKIRQVYNVKAGFITKSVKIKKATRNDLTAAIMASEANVQLAAFSPRQTNKGVTIKIKSNRILIKHAFIQDTTKGIGVFARGKYKGANFDFRKKRNVMGKDFRMINGIPVPIDAPDMPISQLYTLSVPIMFKEKNVEKAVADKIEQYYPERLMHEIMYLLERRGAK